MYVCISEAKIKINIDNYLYSFVDILYLINALLAYLMMKSDRTAY